MGLLACPLPSMQGSDARDERSYSHHSKSQGPDVTALKQGHFFSPINHILDVAKAITGSWFDFKGFSSVPMPSRLEFQSLSLSPSFSLKNSQPYCSEIRNHITSSRGLWQQILGARRCTPVTNNVICAFYHDPVTPQGHCGLSEGEWNPSFSMLGPDARCIIKWVTL